MDLVSVIVPVYRVEDYLDRCVQSIVDQTYRNLEIILVDDGSPDNCGAMCDVWATKDSRIKVIHKENGGVSSARNAALDCIQGKYVFFVDSDDYIDKTYLEHYIDVPDCDYVVGQHRRTANQFPPCAQMPVICLSVEEYKKSCADYWAKLRISNVWSVRYKTSIIQESNLRFNKSMKWGEDTFFNISYLSNCLTLCAVPIQEYVYCVNSCSLSAKYESTRHDDSLRLMLHFDSFAGDSPQAWRIKYMYWEMSAKHYLNHLNDNLDSSAKKQIQKDLYRSQREPYFRDVIPDVMQKGTLDMKLFVLCLKYGLARIYPFLQNLLSRLSTIKKSIVH